MENEKQKVVIAGAGLVGSLLSIFLVQRGYKVQVLEKRADPRHSGRSEGRSINLALSHRGLKAMHAADPELPSRVLTEAIAMYGRQMHDEQGRLSFQPYSSTNECIYSVSRSRLNNCLINAAEEYLYQHPEWKRIQFDILSITILKNQSPEYFLIEDVHL